jgi:hypothetical protein
MMPLIPKKMVRVSKKLNGTPKFLKTQKHVFLLLKLQQNGKFSPQSGQPLE